MIASEAERPENSSTGIWQKHLTILIILKRPGPIL